MVHVPCWVDIKETQAALLPIVKKYEELSKKGKLKFSMIKEEGKNLFFSEIILENEI